MEGQVTVVEQEVITDVYSNADKWNYSLISRIYHLITY